MLLHVYTGARKEGDRRRGAGEPLGTQSSRTDWLGWAMRLRRDGRC